MQRLSKTHTQHKSVLAATLVHTNNPIIYIFQNLFALYYKPEIQKYVNTNEFENYFEYVMVIMGDLHS